MDKERYVWIKGEKIPVSEEVYRTYYRPEWHEAKRKENHDDDERSYEQMFENGYDLQSDSDLVDDIVADKLLLDELYAALAELTDDERFLIHGLYYENQSIREFAKTKGTNHTKIVRQHKSILERLRNILKK